jgi:hypothetical protein
VICGADEAVGALPLLAAVTTTSCSTVAVRPAASVIVSVTYLVPTTLNVKLILCPDPSAQLPPDGGSSAHEYVQGAYEHDDADPSNDTDWPVTGAPGEYVNPAVGACGAATMAVALELAVLDPAEFEAVTTARMV